MSMTVSRWCWLSLCASLCATVGAMAGWADRSGQADLFLRVDGRGSVEIMLALSREPAAPTARLLEQGLGRVLRGPLYDVDTGVVDGEWRLHARSDGTFARHGLRVEDRLDASPLLRPLRRTGVPWLTLNLIHRRVP